jgi:hypothetical protein
MGQLWQAPAVRVRPHTYFPQHLTLARPLDGAS